MSERGDEADPQTKIRLINPLAYTHPWPCRAGLEMISIFPCFCFSPY